MSEDYTGRKYGFATRAVHAGNDVGRDSGAIKRPIELDFSVGLEVRK